LLFYVFLFTYKKFLCLNLTSFNNIIAYLLGEVKRYF